MNDENLIPHRFTPEEARENGRKGGKASAAAKRRRKTQRELARMIAESAMSPKVRAEVEKQIGKLADDDASLMTALLFKMTRLALKGDMRAMEKFLELAGEDDVFRPSGEEDELSKSLRELGKSL
nr:MAG TPA: Stress-induced bacterial acidophilic repeat motif [Caudoviricetes sp.]